MYLLKFIKCNSTCQTVLYHIKGLNNTAVVIGVFYRPGCLCVVSACVYVLPYTEQTVQFKHPVLQGVFPPHPQSPLATQPITETNKQTLSHQKLCLLFKRDSGAMQMIVHVRRRPPLKLQLQLWQLMCSL